jgi:hypothetical protein
MRSLPIFLIFLSLPAWAQNDTQPPPNQHPALTVTGKGVQIYSCQNVSGKPQWVLQAPEAKLFNTAGVELGTHGAGPIWTMKNDSSVKGTVVAKSDAPAAGDIQWLLLKATGGTGGLRNVEFIRRSETQGGMAPAGRCEIGHTERVPYSATYTFYQP